jgi:PIN domain nuclease of toxin-antitoxin system
MIVGVADTHTALWLLFDDKRLSKAAGDFIENAAAQRRSIAVSAITVAEVVYLVEKGRVPANAYQVLKDALADPEHVLTDAPFTAEIVESLRKVLRTAVPDMPDRIIAATSLHFGVPLISCDGQIQAANLPIIW